MTDPVDEDQAAGPVLVAGPDGPTTPELLGQQPAAAGATPADLTIQAAAVNALVRRWLAEPVPVPPATVAYWSSDVTLGATMLAARLYRRRNSAGGVEVYGGDGPAYVRRNDPDVAMLLGLGEYAPIRVG